MSHAAFLGGLLMFMRSIDTPHRTSWVAGSVLIGWLGLLAYDSNIVVFGLMLLWLVLKWPTVRACLNHGRNITLFVAILGKPTHHLFCLAPPLRFTRVSAGLHRLSLQLSSY